jgi:serine/threonine-protein kinase
VVGGDPEAGAFSDGLSETLSAKLTELARSHSLQVVPATEVRTQGVKTADQARREFGVNLVLEGSLHRSGDVVRVTYALVDARARRQLRAGTITVRAADVFALEDQVVQEAARMLDLEMRPEERETLAMHGTQVASAYDLYLQGRGYLQNYHKPEDVENAINVLKRALELDPSYALAYAGLGEAYWRKYDTSHEISWLDSAREACGRAVKLDTKLAAAHICLGTLASRTGHYDKAVEEFQRAVGKEPGNDDAYRGLASAYEDLGKLPDAERTYRRAIELHPSYWAGYRDLAAFYYRHGRYSEAEKQLHTVLELTPDNVRAYTGLGAIYHLMGKDDDAVEVLKKSLAIKPTPEAYTNLGTIYHFEGRYRDAVPMMEKAVEFGGANYKLWGNLAEAYYRTPELKAKAPEAYTQALQLARKQLSINSKDGEAWAWLAVYSVKLGEKDKALGATEHAWRLAPGNVNVLFRAAQVYELAGDRERALKALESAVKGGYSTDEIRTAADLAELRKDPRYQRLMAGRTSH